MKKNPPKNNVITALREHWYAKLKEKGFEDIEDSKGLLKSWSAVDNRIAPLTREAQEEYYRLAGQYLYSESFSSAVHRLIWKLHAQGFDSNQIAQKTGLYRKTIEYRLRIMRTRFFKPPAQE